MTNSTNCDKPNKLQELTLAHESRYKRTSEEIDKTLPRINPLKTQAPISPQGWMGVDFLEMTSYNPKKFTSRFF